MLNHNFKDWLVECPEYGVNINPEFRYLFSDGGRGGGKSHWIAQMLILVALNRPIKVLCAREFQNSINDSVLSLLETKINEIAPDRFRITKNEIIGVNGSYFSFCGLARNIGSVKSKDDYDICWIEEGQYISAKAWEILKPTIRKHGSQFIISMNRDSEEAILDIEFIQNTPPPRTIRTTVNYWDNPFDIPVLIEDAEHCKRVNIDAYHHIWGGGLNRISEAQVLGGRFVVEEFETPEEVKFYHGADWSNGGADPHTLVRCFMDGDILYIDYEMIANIDPDQLTPLWEEFPSLVANPNERHRMWRVWGDSAQPYITKIMYKAGFNCENVSKKWARDKSSVKAGIDYLRSFEKIVVHPRCTEWAREARNWSWEVDERSGKVLPILKKGNDHLMDATRYALVDEIKSGRRR